MRTPFLAALVITPVLVSHAIAQPDVAEWERRMLAGEHASAAGYARDLAEQHEQSSVWAYRTAAALSRAGETEAALAWLRAAANRGYSGVRTVATDEDIAGIRSLPGFSRVADSIRANAAQRLEGFKKAAATADPVELLPRGHDASVPSPLVLVLHGSGGTGREMARAFRRAASRCGAILVAPDAIRPWGNGFGWTYRDEAEWYVQSLIASARERHDIDRIVLAGFSQGANVALAMGRSHPDLVDAVLAVSGHWEADAAPMPGGDDRPRWMLLIGERDPWADTYEHAERSLRNAGMTATRRAVPGLGHALAGPGELEDALRWCLTRDDTP
jgi:phospholipase/carboxylesterase